MNREIYMNREMRILGRRHPHRQLCKTIYMNSEMRILSWRHHGDMVPTGRWAADHQRGKRRTSGPSRRSQRPNASWQPNQSYSVNVASKHAVSCLSACWRGSTDRFYRTGCNSNALRNTDSIERAIASRMWHACMRGATKKRRIKARLRSCARELAQLSYREVLAELPSRSAVSSAASSRVRRALCVQKHASTVRGRPTGFTRRARNTNTGLSWKSVLSCWWLSWRLKNDCINCQQNIFFAMSNIRTEIRRGLLLDVLSRLTDVDVLHE